MGAIINNEELEINDENTPGLELSDFEILFNKHATKMSDVIILPDGSKIGETTMSYKEFLAALLEYLKIYGQKVLKIYEEN